MKRFLVFAGLFAAAFTAVPGAASAHAFPEHQVPGAGAKLDRPPKVVTIRFDRALEPAFSVLRVENSAGSRVDANDSHAINDSNDTLEVTLKPLASGQYHVFWTAVARDGHRSHGDYMFTVRKSAR